MLKISLLLCVLCGYCTLAAAAVPTYTVWNDSLTLNLPIPIKAINYYGSVINYLKTIKDIAKTTNDVKQIKSLKDLEYLANNLCEACDGKDKLKFKQFIDQSNKILATQFDLATGSIKRFENFGDAIQNIITQLQADPQQAALALQRSASEIQANTQSTLAQIQVLLINQQQRDAVIAKQTQSNLSDMYNGLAHSGL